jgi:hypothetical protein
MASMGVTTEIIQAEKCHGQVTSVGPCRGRIKWLVAAHVVAMLAMARFQPVGPVDLSGTLEFAQSNLLGVWFAFSAGSWRRRLLKSFGCLLVVAVMKEGPTRILSMAVDIRLLPEIVIIHAIFAATAWLTAAGGLAIVKLWGPKLKLTYSSEAAPQASAVQFSIRSLLIATLITAINLSAAIFIRAHLDPTPDSIWLFLCIYVPAFAVYSVAVVVASVWAGLGVSHLGLRTAAAVGLQLTLSLLLSFAFLQTWDLERTVWMAAQQLAETAIVIGSLFVVRSCGYRIVAQAAKPISANSNADPSEAAHALD